MWNDGVAAWPCSYAKLLVCVLPGETREHQPAHNSEAYFGGIPQVPVHAQALQVATNRGSTSHGQLRAPVHLLPSWVTCEANALGALPKARPHL
jgi:hypothetical protein